jgi:hypothetical protein
VVSVLRTGIADEITGLGGLEDVIRLKGQGLLVGRLVFESEASMAEEGVDNAEVAQKGKRVGERVCF